MFQSKTTERAVSLIWIVCIVCVGAFSQIAPLSDRITEGAPRFIRFEGLLKDGSGYPLNGEVNVTFAVYNKPDGGIPIWAETQTVQFWDGHYSVLLGLGSETGVPPDLISSGESRWLGVHPLRDGEQERPRVFLASVPYALKAAEADTLGGLPASAFVRIPSPAYSVSAVAPDADHALPRFAYGFPSRPAGTLNPSPSATNQGWSFSNPPLNKGIQTLFNNCSPSFLYSTLQGPGKYATEGVTSCITAPFGFYNYQSGVNAISGYVDDESSATVLNPVAVSGIGYVGSSGGHAWGANFVAYDKLNLSGASEGLFGVEVDTQPQNSPSVYGSAIGVLSNLFTPLPGIFTNANAFVVEHGQAGIWNNGYFLKDSSAAIAMNIGAACAVAGTNSCSSMPLAFSSSNSGSRITANPAFFLDSSGNETWQQANGESNWRIVNSTNSAELFKVDNTGIAQSSGFKHQRFGTTCSTLAIAGSTCTTTETWEIAFPDANYTVSCSGVSPTGTPSLSISAKQIATSVTVRVTAITAAASSFDDVDCIATHD